jgi:hypothetical protein
MALQATRFRPASHPEERSGEPELNTIEREGAAGSWSNLDVTLFVTESSYGAWPPQAALEEGHLHPATNAKSAIPHSRRD